MVAQVDHNAVGLPIRHVKNVLDACLLDSMGIFDDTIRFYIHVSVIWPANGAATSLQSVSREITEEINAKEDEQANKQAVSSTEPLRQRKEGHKHD